MSIFDTCTATCPACGRDGEFDAVVSVNADRRPDLRVAILDGTFQAVDCPHCGAKMRIPPSFTYLDIGRGQWIAVHPPAAALQWPAHEAHAREAFDAAFGAAAPAAAQEIAAGITPRLAFGWAALQEKLLVADLALDDATLELLKLVLLGNADGLTIGADTEMRLAGGDDTSLALDWLDAGVGAVRCRFIVPRQAYEDVRADAGEWASLRARVEGHSFVDLGRLMLEDAAN